MGERGRGVTAEVTSIGAFLPTAAEPCPSQPDRLCLRHTKVWLLYSYLERIEAKQITMKLLKRNLQYSNKISASQCNINNFDGIEGCLGPFKKLQLLYYASNQRPSIRYT